MYMPRYCVTQSNQLSAKTTKLSAIAIAILYMQSHSAMAALPPIVMFIDNIANAQYHFQSNSAPLVSTSNQVRVQASTLQKYDVLLSNAPLRTIAAGDRVSWKNTLTNNSYNDETISLSYQYPNTLSNFTVYQDINKNGTFDKGDIDFTQTKQIKLSQNESIELRLSSIV